MVKVTNTRKGFTLIELLISVGVLAVALTLTSGVLLSVVRSSQKQKILAEIERNGDYTMTYIEKMVSQALSATSQTNPPDQIILGQLTNTLYIGKATGTQFSCNGSNVSNNYVYATTDIADVGDSKKLTNDSINGVNVSELNFAITSGNPTHVTVTMTVEGSKCGSWDVSKQFKSFITVRGTY